MNTERSTGSAVDVTSLIIELQSVGLRVEAPVEPGQGGAGPSDSGMMWMEVVPATVPTQSEAARRSPYVLEAEDDGQGIYRDGVELAVRSRGEPPPAYRPDHRGRGACWKIALLHLDSLASTVLQDLQLLGPDLDRAGSAASGSHSTPGARSRRSRRRSSPRSPSPPVTSTGPSMRRSPPGAPALRTAAPVRRRVRPGGEGGLRVARRGAVRPPARPRRCSREVHAAGIDAVGIHVEWFDPTVLARVAPGKFRTGIETYFRTWEGALSSLFGEGRVSTYVILGMGEDPDLTITHVQAGREIGVYPFVVPLRPVAGSLMEDVAPPHRLRTPSRLYPRGHGDISTERGHRCRRRWPGAHAAQACSGINGLQHELSRGKPLLQIGSRPGALA